MLVRRDSFGPRGYVLVSALFVAVVISGIIVGSVSPPQHVVVIQNAYNCSSPWSSTVICPGGVELGRNSTEWSVTFTNLSPLNEEMFVLLNLQNKYPLGVLHTQPISITVRVRDSLTSNWTVLANSTRARNIECEEGSLWCSPNLLFHRQFVKWLEYRFTIRLADDDSLHGFIGNAILMLSVRNGASTQHEAFFRFAMFLGSLGMLIYFVIVMYRFKWKDYTVEQKWTLVLLCMLCGFNNPLYPLELILVGWFFPFLNIALETAFVCALLLFWFIMLDNVRQEAPNDPRPLLAFYVPKFVVVGLLFLLFMIMYCWQTFTELDDPIYLAPNEMPFFKGFVAAAAVLFALYLLWMVYLSVRAVERARETDQIRRPFIFFGVTTLFTIIATICGIAYAIFLSQDSAVQIMLFFSALNGYVWMLAFMYSPSKHSLPGKAGRNQVPLAEVAAPERLTDEEAGPVPASPMPAPGVGAAAGGVGAAPGSTGSLGGSDPAPLSAGAVAGIVVGGDRTTAPSARQDDYHDISLDTTR